MRRDPGRLTTVCCSRVPSSATHSPAHRPLSSGASRFAAEGEQA
jgi:hypothetical protein